MTTYTDEVNIYNPEAVKDEINSAKQTADNYITEVTDNGIVVAAEGKGTVNGVITSSTTGWHLADVLEFVRHGVSRFWIGLKNSGDTTPTVRIGKAFVNGAEDNESHMELDYHSMQMVDKNGITFMHVSDLVTSDGYAAITDSFTGDGTTVEFETSCRIGVVASVSVKVDGSAVTVSGVSYPKTVTLESAPASGATVVIEYLSFGNDLKAFTFGSRSGGVGPMSFVAGETAKATGYISHAEGYSTEANGFTSHAEGHSTKASKSYAHAQNYYTKANGEASHAEGTLTQANGQYSHAEGYATRANSQSSHAEGGFTEANGFTSHAEGRSTRANGQYSHAQNESTVASSEAQTALGKWNIEDANGDYAVIVGNGAYESRRSNALTVDWSGNVDCGTVNGVDVTSIGEQETPVNATESVASNSNTDVASIHLPAGTWIVWGKVEFPANSSGRRAVKLSTTSQEPDNVMSTTNRNASSSGTTQISTSRCFTLASAGTVYLVGWQNSGSSLSCIGDIEATRFR